MVPGALDGGFVAGIRMPHDAACGIVPQDAGNATISVFRPITDDDQSRMLRVAHPDSPAVMKGNPGCTAGRIHQRVQQRPVGDRIRAIAHGFCFPIRAGYGAAVKVIPADRYRRAQFTASDHFIESQAQLVALAQPDPADARR